MSTMKHVSQSNLISAMCLTLAVAITAAILTQFATGIALRGMDPWNFFSFFTIESNIFAAIVLVLGTVTAYQQKTWFNYLRGAMTLCMVTTGIIYVTLLSGLEVSLQTTIPWVNLVLHYLSPVLVFLWWIIFPPHHRFSIKQNMFWLALPLLYVAYSLVRGPFVDWYPYPFLDPREGGYGMVLFMSVIIFVALVGVVTALTWISRLVKTPRRR